MQKVRAFLTKAADNPLVRKVVLTWFSAASAVWLAGATDVINAFANQDWNEMSTLGVALIVGGAAAGARALLSYLFAFEKSDAQRGLNLAGKFKDVPKE